MFTFKDDTRGLCRPVQSHRRWVSSDEPRVICKRRLFYSVPTGHQKSGIQFGINPCNVSFHMPLLLIVYTHQNLCNYYEIAISIHVVKSLS